MYRMVANQGKRLTMGATPSSSASPLVKAAFNAILTQKRTYAEVLPFLNPAMASQAKADEVAEKYREKLLQKAKAEGASSIDELKDKYKDKIESQKKVYEKADPYAKLHETSDTPDNQTETAKAASEALKNAPKVPSSDIKSLDTFIDVSKFMLHNNKEIEMLWKMRFSSNPRAICGLVAGDTFATIYKNARKNPMFILPLPHEAPDAEKTGNGGGVEMHLVQWSFVGPYTIHCIFTTLAEYKLHQEYAKPHTTLIFHSDLLADKAIALLNGTVEKDATVTMDEAHLLTLFLQKFYSATPATESGRKKLELLSAFTTGDENFSLDELLNQAQIID